MDSRDAVHLRRAHFQIIEVVEEARVANAVAAQLRLEFSCKLLETFTNLGNLSLVVRVLGELSQLKVVQILVAVPEIGIGNGSSSAVDENGKVTISI